MTDPVTETSLLLSLLRFLAEEAPELMPSLEVAVVAWAEREFPAAVPVVRRALKLARARAIEFIARRAADEAH